MIRSRFTNQMIRDYFFKIRLHDFLQDSLAIKKEFLVLQIFQNKSMYKLFCISKTTIKINCSDQSLHCIRCYRFSLSSPGSVFSFTKQKVFTKIQISCTECQRRFTYHTCPRLRKFPFRKLWIIVKQKFTGYQFKNCIPQKFQPFITFILRKMFLIGVRTMNHRLCKQGKVIKFVTNLSF